MFGFGKKSTKNYLGIDIGAGGVKIVELMNEKGRGRLITYGYSERGVSEDGLHPLEDVKGTAAVVADICKKSGVSTMRAVGALPLSSVFSAIVAVPRGKDEKAVKEAVNEQVKKLAPMPLEEMITYSTFIDPLKIKEDKKTSPGQNPEVKKYVRVLVTGAAKTLVQKYVEIFKLAKVELLALDTEAFALIRSLIGKDKGSVMIIDLGYASTNFTIVEKESRFSRVASMLAGKPLLEK